VNGCLVLKPSRRSRAYLLDDRRRALGRRVRDAALEGALDLHDERTEAVVGLPVRVRQVAGQPRRLEVERPPASTTSASAARRRSETASACSRRSATSCSPWPTTNCARSRFAWSTALCAPAIRVHHVAAAASSPPRRSRMRSEKGRVEVVVLGGEPAAALQGRFRRLAVPRTS
jgi:hypothetical protein